MTTVDFNQLQMAFESTIHRFGRREDYIRQLSRRDPELANEVVTLLAFETESRDPLEAACRMQQLKASADSSIPEIQGYVVNRRIGVGGQADVYLARQESTGQDVAIKVFRGCGLVDSQHHRIDAETTLCDCSFPMSWPSWTGDKRLAAGNSWRPASLRDVESTRRQQDYCRRNRKNLRTSLRRLRKHSLGFIAKALSIAI